MTPVAVLTFVAKLLDAILDMVPADVARQALDEAAIRRASRIADLAEDEKFGRLADSIPPEAGE